MEELAEWWLHAPLCLCYKIIPKKGGLDDTRSRNRSYLLSPWAFQKLDLEKKKRGKMAKGEWNEIPFAFKNRMEQKWIRAGEEKCLGSGLLCRLRRALMRQISSAVALLIFNPGNIRPGKSGTEISMDVWVGYLCLSLLRLYLLPESVGKPMLSQLSDNTQPAPRLSFIDMILDWKDRPWIQH